MSPDSRYFSEAHELFRTHLRAFVLRELAPRADEWERAGLVPREVFRRMGELGYLGIRFGSEYGGSGLDHWYTVVLCEELMRSLSVGIGVSMLVQSEFATAVLHDEGPEELRRALPPPAGKGGPSWAPGGAGPGQGGRRGQRHRGAVLRRVPGAGPQPHRRGGQGLPVHPRPLPGGAAGGRLVRPPLHPSRGGGGARRRGGAP